MRKLLLSLTAATLFFTADTLQASPATPANRQAESPAEQVARLHWLTGQQPVTGKAAIRLPPGIRALSEQDTNQLLKITGNLPEKDSYAIAPKDLSWFAVFDFADIGYVKDSEKIDAAALLSTMRTNQEEANKQRQASGLSPLTVNGWAVAPHYDQSTHNLEYGTILGSADGENVNYTARLLGRHGVMTATLISDAATLQSNVTAFHKALAGFGFVPDEGYQAFRDGDKVSEYGLAALITGGAAAAVVKAGLFKGLLAGLFAFWKLIAVGAVAAFAAINRFVKRLTGHPNATGDE